MKISLEDRIHDLLNNTKSLKKSVDMLLDDKFKDAENLSDGFTKYSTAIKSEIRFLEKLFANPEDIKEAHLQGSNYAHLRAVYELMVSENCHHVFKAVHVDSSKLKKTIRIDLVADRGSRWIKVKAVNLKTLEHEFHAYDSESETDDEDGDSDIDQSEAGYGDTKIVSELTLPDPPMIKQAKLILRAAQQNPVHFKPPKVVYRFVGLETIPQIMFEQLGQLGVLVEFGNTIPRPPSVDYYYLTSILNLDITTLLAMVSDITFRFNEISLNAFDSKPLKVQYQSEKTKPMLPILRKMFRGKQLVTTYAAFTKFKKIVDTIGGPFEQQRAANLFGETADCRITIMEPQPTLDFPSSKNAIEWKVLVIPNHASPHFKELDNCKLKDHNVEIFGTGDYHRISTITANSGIQRSLEKCGQDYAIEIHEPRGLIEQKWIRYASKNKVE